MKHILSIIICLITFAGGRAQTADKQSITTSTVTETVTVINVVNDSLSRPQPVSPTGSPFAWGLDLGSAIDMTSQDMTSMEIDACLGFKNRFFRILGVGAGIRMMTSNSSRCYPIYALMRTSFTTRPSLLFGEIRSGISINNYYNDIFQRRFFGTIGVGITLAHGRTFSSHVILAYEYQAARKVEVPNVVKPLGDIHAVSIRIGASF